VTHILGSSSVFGRKAPCTLDTEQPSGSGSLRYLELTHTSEKRRVHVFSGQMDVNAVHPASLNPAKVLVHLRLSQSSLGEECCVGMSKLVRVDRFLDACPICESLNEGSNSLVAKTRLSSASLSDPYGRVSVSPVRLDVQPFAEYWGAHDDPDRSHTGFSGHNEERTVLVELYVLGLQ
jgi:hypothetical protein